jgi:hypothetical protein
VYYRRALPVLAGMSAAGAAWAAVLIIGLLADVRLLPLSVAALVAAALVIPGFAASVVTSAAKRRNRSGGLGEFWQLLSHVPKWTLATSAGLFFAFWLAGMTSFAGIAGSAGIQDGQYVVNNHGTVTVIDKVAYDREVAHEERLALGVLGAFGVAGATLGAATAARARSTA